MEEDLKRVCDCSTKGCSLTDVPEAPLYCYGALAVLGTSKLPVLRAAFGLNTIILFVSTCALGSSECCSGAEDGKSRLKKQFSLKTVCAPWNVLSPSGLIVCKMLLKRDIM